MYNASWCRRKFPLKKDAVLRFSCRSGWWRGRARPVNSLHGWVARSEAVENLCLLTFLLNHGCSIAFRLYATLILFLPSASHPKFHKEKNRKSLACRSCRGLIKQLSSYEPFAFVLAETEQPKGKMCLLLSIIIKKLHISEGIKLLFVVLVLQNHLTPTPLEVSCVIYNAESLKVSQECNLQGKADV